ncbi:MAG: hypothetical protein J6I85_06370 [Clostridia bacterium]|nr:hypothetical protein [Clostridia bacterium]
MRNVLFIILSFLLLAHINSKFLRFLQSQSLQNSYDYSNYNSKSTNENLSSKTLESTTKDESVVYITKSGISITNSNLKKTSGESSNTENSEFYGVNAAVLVQGGEVTITGGTIQTSAKGANAICATNKGNVIISETKITSTASGSARGLHSTFGGSITASNVEITTTGGSCATLATDKGEGKVTCTECNLSTGGAGSPLIYSTGEISVSKTKGTATGAQMVVVEGKNTASVLDNSELKCNGNGNRNNIDVSGVMLYQSFSGDAATGTSTFNCKNSQMEILSSSSVYSSAPMFFITNTDSIINIENCSFSYGSNIFLSAKGTSAWGNSGSNGGVVTLNLKNQKIEGNFYVDEYSGVTINLVNSQIKGTFNSDNNAAKLAIILDKDSSITLTGNSYYTSITNEDSTGNNINYGNNYNFTKSDGKEINRSSGNGNQGGNTQNGSGTPPNGSGTPPNGSGTPPNGSGTPPNGSGTPPNGSGTPPNGSGTPPNGSGTPPNGSGTPPNGSGTPPNGSGTPPNGSGTPPNGSGAPPNGSGTPPNGNETGSIGAEGNNNNNEADEDEAFIAKYFSSNQNFLKFSYLLFVFILL